MSYILSDEDVVSNMFINKLDRCPDCCRFVSYKSLEDYGNTVVEFLNSKLMPTVWICYRDTTDYMLMRYSEYFIECTVNDKLGIKLRDTISSNDLILRFRGYLPIDILLAFCNQGVFDCYENKQKED